MSETMSGHGVSATERARSAFLTIGGRTMLIAEWHGRLADEWIHLRDAEDVALCGKQGLREATPREANGARGVCPDCNERRP